MRPRLTRDHQVDVDRIRARRRVILEKATEILSVTGSRSAGIYLCEAMEPDILHNILDDLDASRLPRLADTTLSSSTIHQVTKLSVDGLQHLATVLRALSGQKSDHPHPRWESLVDECLGLLLVRWSDITKWVGFALRYTSIMLQTRLCRLVVMCAVQLLDTVVDNEDNHPYKHELLSLPSTADLLIDLVCLIDPQTKRPTHITLRNRSSTCSIAETFFNRSCDTTVREGIAARLCAAGREKRNKFVTFILHRVQDVAAKGSNGDTVSSVSTDLSKLVSASMLYLTTPLIRCFKQHNFVYEVSRAVKTVLDEGMRLDTENEGFWMNIANCLVRLGAFSTLPGFEFTKLGRKMCEGGIIQSLLYTLPRCCKDAALLLDGVARKMLCFLTDGPSVRAIATAGGIGPSSDTYIQGRSHSQAFQRIYDGYFAGFQRGSLAFFEGRATTVCFNTKHGLSSGGSARHFKRCGKCHFFLYCSEACQREDWLAFHSKECSKVHEECTDQAMDSSDVSIKVIKDKLIYLEVSANECLPPLPELRRSQREPGCPSEEPVIVVFDFNAGLIDEESVAIHLGSTEYPLSQYLEDMKGITLGQWEAEARTLSLVEDMEMDQDTFVLVEGLFGLNDTTMVSLLAMMEYSSESGTEERYKILGTSVRLSVRIPPGEEI